MRKISLKIQLASFLLVLLAFAAYRESSIGVLLNGVIAAVASILADAACGFAKERKVKFSESALITGLLVGFVLSAQGPWWSVAAAAVIAILSKHLIRIKGRHVFNPAALGSFAALFLFGNTTQWYGAYDWYLVIPFGIYFVHRFKRLPTVLAFYVTAFALYGAQAWLQKISFVDAIVYLNHFFIFIMLIEPKTSPFDRIGMLGFGTMASMLCFGLSFVPLPVSAELPVLLTLNAVYGVYLQSKGGKR